MLVEFDTDSNATRFYVNRFPGLDPTAEILDVSEDVSVDIDEDGRALAVEVLVGPCAIEPLTLEPLRERFPSLIGDVLHALDAMKRSS
jgi:uncharacterized protein YuzE